MNRTRAKTLSALLYAVPVITFMLLSFVPAFAIGAATMLIIAPWLTVLLCRTYPEKFSFEDTNKIVSEKKFTITLLPFSLLSTIFMVLYLLQGRNILNLDHAHLLAISIGGALFLALHAINALGKAKNLTLLYFLLIGVPYGYGSSLLANILLDTSRPEPFRTHILQKHYYNGKGAHGEFTLDAWGEQPSGMQVRVKNDLYNALNNGDIVCITLHPGAFNIPWYTTAICAP